MLLKQQNAEAFLGQAKRAGKPAQARTDDDGIVLIRHLTLAGLEAEDGRADKSGVLAASAFLEVGEGAGGPQIGEEDVLGLEDAAGEGEDLRGEGILVHLDPFGEHLEPIVVDLQGFFVFGHNQIKEFLAVSDL